MLLVMAECMEGKEEIFKQNNRWHFAICEESGWQLPALAPL